MKNIDAKKKIKAKKEAQKSNSELYSGVSTNNTTNWFTDISSPFETPKKKIIEEEFIPSTPKKKNVERDYGNCEQESKNLIAFFKSIDNNKEDNKS